jgi:hypothetical protein
MQSKEETKNYDFSIILPQYQQYLGGDETADGGVVASDSNRSLLIDSSSSSFALSSASSSLRKRKSMNVNSSSVPSSTSKLLLQPTHAEMENTHPNQSPSISSGPVIKVPRIGLVSSASLSRSLSRLRRRRKVALL